MRKPIPYVLTLLVIVFLVASGMLYQKLQQRNAAYATLQADEQATRDRYSEAITEIAAIQDSLNAIVLGEEGAAALKTQLDAETKLSQDRGDAARARIAEIKAGIERARDRIATLEAQLKESGVKIAGLEKMIKNLRATVAEKETLIVALNQRVDELQTEVAGLHGKVAERDQTIQAREVTIQTQVARLEESRRALGTIYYTIGTKDELKDSGTIVATGGFLRLGRTWRPSGSIDPALFTPMDTDQETSILIPADEVKVISDQPLSSYTLELVGEQMELRITDPQAFRAVKHLILMTG
ncbi:hypothetical protein FJ251_08560 [bacterium]|nr:hypothetical protein [bacterium]